MTLVASKDGKELGRQELKFTVIAPADELLQLASRPQVLAEMSAKTGALPTILGSCRNWCISC